VVKSLVHCTISPMGGRGCGNPEKRRLHRNRSRLSTLVIGYRVIEGAVGPSRAPSRQLSSCSMSPQARFTRGKGAISLGGAGALKKALGPSVICNTFAVHDFELSLDHQHQSLQKAPPPQTAVLRRILQLRIGPLPLSSVPPSPLTGIETYITSRDSGHLCRGCNSSSARF
jgi:hypothetical protein